jgi:hypothetical protein
MKKQSYMLSLLLLLITVFTSPAFAGDHKKEPVTTALPINNAVAYLVIVGLVIGCIAAYKLRSTAIEA